MTADTESYSASRSECRADAKSIGLDAASQGAPSCSSPSATIAADSRPMPRATRLLRASAASASSVSAANTGSAAGPSVRPSWSSTLQLPKSSFPARPDPKDHANYLRRCTTGLYEWQKEARKDQPAFFLHDGPPYANGQLHIGHALNKVLKDITLRVQLTKGRRVEYVPGWDCHGLPIELKALQKQREEEVGNAVEKNKTKRPDGPAKTQDAVSASTITRSKDEYDPIKVRSLARGLATETVEQQRAAFKEWAILGDWDNAWTTMQPDFELRQLMVFKRMLEKGLIYRQFKPVYWSPSTRTALAEGELEYKLDHTSTAAFVRFEAVDQERLRNLFGIAQEPDEKISFLIWTTTPWTLPANKAIVVRNDMSYVCAHFEGIGYLIVAESRLADVEKRCQIEHTGTVSDSVEGAQLVDLTYRNDAFHMGQTSRILHGDYVLSGSGTGLVHMAPGHGMEDYKLAKQHDIEPFTVTDDLGRFTRSAFDPGSPVENLVGKAVSGQGTVGILEFLESTTPSDSSQVIHSYKYMHSYPYDWRSKKPVIIRATAQWFADLSEIKDLTTKAIEDIEFIPATGKSRLLGTVKTRTEWCISRQRAWGVPIPALYRKDNGESLLTPDSVQHILSVIQERGVDAWWTDAERDEAWVPLANRDVEYTRGRDTLDVWFDSGTSWTHMGRKPSNDGLFESQTSDIYLEGSDQHRGWFQSSILTKIAFDSATGNVPVSPFKTLITHGFTLDGKGKKMSKSEGNVVSPGEIIKGTLLPPIKRKGKNADGSKPGVSHDSLGPDMLRWLVANSDYTKDVQIGKDVLKGLHQSLAKLRVTFKLLAGLLDDFRLDDPAGVQWRVSDLGLVNRIALLHLQSFSQRAWPAYDAYEYHRVAVAINEYVNNDFSAFYNEAIKDRMYASQPDGAQRRQTQFVLWHIYEELSAVLRPITPLLVEEANAHMPESLRVKSSTPIALPRRLLHEDDLFSTSNDNSNDKVLRLNMSKAGADVPYTSLQDLNDIVLPCITDLHAVIKGQLEKLRAEKKLGSGLQAHVSLLNLITDETGDINCHNRGLGLIKSERGFSEELAAIFVVSSVNYREVRNASDSEDGQLLGGLLTKADGSLKSGGFCETELSETPDSKMQVTVFESKHHKCDRCWRYMSEEKDALCRRCEEVIGESDLPYRGQV